MTAKFPEDLEGFVPKRLIGSGGFGSVWLARQRNLDRLVAIKIGRVPMNDPNSALRFERECAALGRLSGKAYIVDVHTSGFVGDGLPYLVMEYVGGGTLKSQGPSFTDSQRTTAMTQLCAAIQSAHDAGILHRDIKPENVFVRVNGEIVVGDFGIARVIDRENTSDGIPATLLYAAPEVLDGNPPSVRSDVYGIGVTMAAVLLGRSPFDDGSNGPVSATLVRILNDAPDELHQHDFDPGLVHAICSAMAKDPMDRPASAADLALLLASNLEEPGPRVTAPLLGSGQPPGPEANANTDVVGRTNPIAANNINSPAAAHASSSTGLSPAKGMVATGVVLACMAVITAVFFLGRSAPSTVAAVESTTSTTIDVVETTEATPTESTEPEQTTSTIDDSGLSSLDETAGAPVIVDQYSYPLELAAGNGCRPGGDRLGDGTWYVTFPQGPPQSSTADVNLVCAFSAESLQTAGVDPDFVGWLFEDRAALTRAVRLSPNVGQVAVNPTQPYEITIAGDELVSIQLPA